MAYPEVQTKAQKELDRVVGSDRAPTWEDLEHLPYIRAVINEVTWNLPEIAKPSEMFESIDPSLSTSFTTVRPT